MDAKTIKLFTSKKSDNWRTPVKLYKKLDDEFNFNFDPCPRHPTFDGLKVDWKERCFVNPPYSKITVFLKKARKEIKKGNCKVAVFLTFANTDTIWFHNYIYKKAEIRFIKGRLSFLDESGNKPNMAMRPSLIAILK